MVERGSHWIGKEEYGGVPTPTRRGDPNPPHWRLEAVAATERPRSISLAADGRTLAFIQDRGHLRRLAARSRWRRSPLRLTAGRDPAPYWRTRRRVVSPDGVTWPTPTAAGSGSWPRRGPTPKARRGELARSGSGRGPAGRHGRARRALDFSQSSLVGGRLAAAARRSGAGLDLRGDEGEAAVSPDLRQRRVLVRPSRRPGTAPRSASSTSTTGRGRVDRRPRECTTAGPSGRRTATGSRSPRSATSGTSSAYRPCERRRSGARVSSRLTSRSSRGAPTVTGALAAIRSARFTHDLVTVAASGGVTRIARAASYGSPHWTADGAYRRHVRGSPDAPEVRLRPGPRRRPCSPAAPLTIRRGSVRASRRKSASRRTAGSRSRRSSTGRGARARLARRRLSARRPDGVLRRRVGRSRPVLRRQGLRLAGPQLPRFDRARQDVRAAELRRLGRWRPGRLPRRRRLPADARLGCRRQARDLRRELWLVHGPAARPSRTRASASGARSASTATATS